MTLFKSTLMKILRIFFAAIAACAISTASAAPEYLNSGKVLQGQFPFSEAVKVGGTLYLSGQIGLVPATQKLAAGGI